MPEYIVRISIDEVSENTVGLYQKELKGEVVLRESPNASLVLEIMRKIATMLKVGDLRKSHWTGGIRHGRATAKVRS